MKIYTFTAEGEGRLYLDWVFWAIKLYYMRRFSIATRQRPVTANLSILSPRTIWKDTNLSQNIEGSTGTCSARYTDSFRIVNIYIMYENRDFYSQVASENWSNLYPDWGNSPAWPVEEVICGGVGRQGGHQVVHLSQQLIQLLADEVLLHTAVCTMQCYGSALVSMRFRIRIQGFDDQKLEKIYS